MHGRGRHRRATSSRRVLQYIGKTEVNGAGVVNYPSGTQEGDFLCLFVISTSAISAPSGWTESRLWTWNTLAYKSYCYTRIKGASDTSVTPAPVSGGCILVVYRGTSGVPTIPQTPAAAQQSGATISVGLITPGDALSLLVTWVCDRDPAAPTNPGGSWTSRSSFVMTFFGNDVSERVVDTLAGTSFFDVWTQNGADAQDAVGLMVEIKP